MTGSSGSLTRDELFSGTFHRDRRARRAVGAIESRVLFTRDETRRALAAFLLGTADGYRRGFDDYLAGIRQRAASHLSFTGEDLERFIDQWDSLLPSGNELRAAVARLLAGRVGLAPDTTPRTLDLLASGDPALAAELAAISARREAPVNGSEAPTPSVLDEVERVTGWVRVAAGELLFDVGSEPDALYFVVSGHLRAEPEAARAGMLQGAEFRRGDVCGETDVLTGETRSTSLRAVRDSELLRVPQAELLEAARRYPDVLLRLTRSMAARLRRDTGQLPVERRLGCRSIALLPAHEGAPVAEAAAGVTSALRSFARLLHVTRADILRQFGEAAVQGSGAEESQLIAWLSEQEGKHEFIVYECDESSSPWAQRAARQSDRVVMVADGQRQAVTTTPEVAGSQNPVVDLLLVHPKNVKRPTNTAGWFRPISPGMVLHWRKGDDAQARSIARRLGGRGISVVMSGGGARGYAHIGAVQALEEAGIEVDVWAGTSMGALMAGGFALGRNADTMREHALRSASRRRLLDFTPPLVAIVRGKKVTELMRRETENLRIEDLWRGYLAIATNLSRSELAVIDQGSLWLAIRASIALPGLYPPVPSEEGELLVDGALMNNMPIDLVRARDDVSTVIGINVSPVRERSTRWNYGPYVSGWPALFKSLGLPVKGRRTPGLVSTLLRATLARSSSAANSPDFLANADLLIEPRVSSFGILDFSACDRLIEAGYNAACEALSATPLPPGNGITR